MHVLYSSQRQAPFGAVAERAILTRVNDKQTRGPRRRPGTLELLLGQGRTMSDDEAARIALSG
jgi:hypothetical protein